MDHWTDEEVELLINSVRTETVVMLPWTHVDTNERGYSFFLWGMESDTFDGPTLKSAWRNFCDNHDMSALRTYVENSLNQVE